MCWRGKRCDQKVELSEMVRKILPVLDVTVNVIDCCLLSFGCRVNNQISDTRLNRTPAQQIRETWRRGLSMITYLSPHEACTPAMAIEVPLVLVWQARIHAVRTHRCSDVLTIRRTGGMSMFQVNC